MTAPPPPPLPPHINRSLIGVRSYTSPSGEPCIELTCDCGNCTVYVMDPADLDQAIASGHSEIALTCDGCKTVRWVVFFAPAAETSP